MVGPTTRGWGRRGVCTRAEEGGKGGVSSWRQEAPSEPADKQCFQTREQGGSNGKVSFSRPALSLPGHGGGGEGGGAETNISLKKRTPLGTD